MGTVQIRRVVIDTNVLVSALLFGGTPGRVVQLWKEERIKPLCSRDIIEEYLRVLTYPKFALAESEIDTLLTLEILPWFEVVEVEPGEPFVKADPFDDRFIWCAVQGEADAIVSGDEHLLKLRSRPLPILTVSEFLRQFPAT